MSALQVFTFNYRFLLQLDKLITVTFQYYHNYTYIRRTDYIHTSLTSLLSPNISLSSPLSLSLSPSFTSSSFSSLSPPLSAFANLISLHTASSLPISSFSFSFFSSSSSPSFSLSRLRSPPPPPISISTLPTPPIQHTTILRTSSQPVQSFVHCRVDSNPRSLLLRFDSSLRDPIPPMPGPGRVPCPVRP